ncbi:MAG: hypothetical protein ACREH8_16030, partial [Opitutaceae bacterium]
HTSVYPRWHDQIHYLSESYNAYEFAQSRGVIAGLLNALTNSSAQGTLHDFFALLVFLVAGPSRSAALSVNMLALIAWQFALFLSVARVHGSRPLALAAAMLPLALGGPWQNIPGSAYDFRLDHMALCALGVTAATGMVAGEFRARRAAGCFGCAAGVTVVMRFLTGAYFVLIFAGLAAWLSREHERKAGLLHLLRAALFATVIAGPVLWINHDSVREFYSIKNYIGPESVIRSPNLDVGRSFGFVVREVAQRHLGWFFLVIAVTGAVVLAAIRSSPARPVNRSGWIIGALFLLSPLVILTLHPQKNEVVAGALAPGVVTLTVAAWAFAARRGSAIAISIFAAAVTSATLAVFFRAQVSTAYPSTLQADFRQINTLADRIVARSHAAGLKEVRVAVDHITDAIDGPVLRVIGYERKRVWMSINLTLPAGTAEPPEGLVMERLAQSDFVLLTEEAPETMHPFDRKLAAMRPQLRTWCEGNLRRTETFNVLGRRMTLYQRREIPFP